MNCSENIRSAWLRDYPRRLPLSLLLLVVLSLLVPATLAQDDDRAGAPVNLDVETTEGGIVLSWQAPASDADQVTGYEVEGLHVRRGTGIVESVTGGTDSETITWIDRMATDPELLYVYRVRALRNGDAGRWSAFVITGIDEVRPAPTIAAPEPEPTEVVPVAPVEPTAAPPEPEPTEARSLPVPEPTTAPVAPPLPEPTRPVPVAPAEPTAARPEPEPTVAPPAVRVEPTAAGPEPEATVSA